MSTTINRSQKQMISRLLKIGILGLVVVAGVYLYTQNRGSSASSQIATTQTAQIAGPVAVTAVNKTFAIPLTNEKKEKIADLNYEIESAEIRKEILVKGNKATAIDGRAFLILNLKIANQSEMGINVNTRNYLRLATNGNTNEWLAPDIHNDPVEVQAISTKKTRIGFPINEADQNLVLQFGDITGEKEQISLNFE